MQTSQVMGPNSHEPVHEEKGLSFAKFDGQLAFREWQSNVLMALDLRELRGYVDESELPEEPDLTEEELKPEGEISREARRTKIAKEKQHQKLLAQYGVKMRKARAIIGMSLQENVRSAVGYSPEADMTAKELWDALTRTYEGSSLYNRIAARRELVRASCREDEDVANYIGRVRAARDRLAAAGERMAEIDMALTLLTGLPASYKGLIESLNNVPESVLTFGFVSERILRERQQRLLQEGERSVALQEAAFYAARAGHGGGKGQVIGGGKGQVTCYNCGKTGHMKRDCWAEGGGGGKRPFHKTGVKGASDRAYVVVAEDLETVETGAGTLGFFFMAEAETLGRRSGARASRASWLLDSGATGHMCHDRDAFVSLQPHCGIIRVGDGRSLEVKGKGTVLLKTTSGLMLELRGVLYVPELTRNLLSVHHLVIGLHAKAVIGPGAEGFRLVQGNQVLFNAAVEPNGTYALEASVVQDKGEGKKERGFAGLTREVGAVLSLWHRRLGHLAAESVLRMAERGSVGGLQGLSGLLGEGASMGFCDACAKGKHKAHPVRVKLNAEEKTEKELRKASEVGHTIHVDVVGPFKTKTPEGGRYALFLTDEASRKKFVFVCEGKGDAGARLKDFIKLVENQTGKTVKAVHSDNGGENVAHDVCNFLREQGIIQELSAPHCPPQNGLAERGIRTMLEVARTWMLEAGAESSLWGEALAAACHVCNRCPHTALGGKTPEEVWTGRKPRVDHLRVWGCEAWVLIPKGQRDGKMGPRSRPMRFVGYAAKHDRLTYRLWDPARRVVYISRDVLFDEASVGSVRERERLRHVVDSGLQDGMVSWQAAVGRHEQGNEDTNRADWLEDGGADSTNEEPGGADLPQVGGVQDDPGSKQERQDEEQETLRQRQQGGQGPAVRATVRPAAGMLARERVTVEMEVEDDGSDQEMVEAPAVVSGKLKEGRREMKGRGSQKNRESAAEYVLYHVFGPETKEDPKSLAELRYRSDRQEWEQAVEAEMSALHENNVFSVTHLPSGQKAISTKFHFVTKHKADGSVEKRKARLVVRGFAQGDVPDTYAPVVRMQSVRAVLAAAATRGHHIQHLDVCSAFLQGELDEEVYVTPPEGMELPPGMVWRLHKPLYGLQQAPKCWNVRLHQVLEEIGFKRSKADMGVYVRKEKDGGRTLLTVWVDDIVLAALETLCQEVSTLLKGKFKMTDLGAASWLLGMEVSRNLEDKTVSLSQKKYVQEVLRAFGMEGCTPLSTPMLPGSRFTEDMTSKTEAAKKDMEHIPYRKLVGSLIYLAGCTRPDISYSVSVLSRYMANFGPEHWTAAKRVLRYLAGTTDHKLEFGGNEGLQLSGWSDSDWGACAETRRSTSGYVFSVGYGALTWASRRQKTAAESSCSAEFMALVGATKEAFWLRALLEDLGHPQHTPTPLHVDNDGARYLALHPTSHERTKHLEVRAAFIRDAIQSGVVQPVRVASAENISDVLTKALGGDKLRNVAQRLGLG